MIFPLNGVKASWSMSFFPTYSQLCGALCLLLILVLVLIVLAFLAPHATGCVVLLAGTVCCIRTAVDFAARFAPVIVYGYIAVDYMHDKHKGLYRKTKQHNTTLIFSLFSRKWAYDKPNSIYLFHHCSELQHNVMLYSWLSSRWSPMQIKPCSALVPCNWWSFLHVSVSFLVIYSQVHWATVRVSCEDSPPSLPSAAASSHSHL